MPWASQYLPTDIYIYIYMYICCFTGKHFFKLYILYSKIDLFVGYRHLHICTDDQDKATFISKDSCYQPLMSGRTSALCTFQMVINSILKEEIEAGFNTVNVDDFCVHFLGRPRGTVGKASASEARGPGFEPPWLLQRSRWESRPLSLVGNGAGAGTHPIDWAGAVFPRGTGRFLVIKGALMYPFAVSAMK